MYMSNLPMENVVMMIDRFNERIDVTKENGSMILVWRTVVDTCREHGCHSDTDSLAHHT